MLCASAQVVRNDARSWERHDYPDRTPGDRQGIWSENRVRAHVLLAMLAYYVEWHLRQAWAELLFKDEEPPIAADPVSKAQRSQRALRKASRQRTEGGAVVHSLRSLMAELALRARNTMRIGDTEATFVRVTKPTPLQVRALQLVTELPVAL